MSIKEDKELSELRDKITEEIANADKGAADAHRHRIAAGKHLIKAKAKMLFKEFTPWLDDNFNLTIRTANNWMRLADPKIEMLAFFKKVRREIGKVDLELEKELDRIDECVKARRDELKAMKEKRKGATMPAPRKTATKVDAGAGASAP